MLSKTTFALETLGLLIACLSWGPSVQAVRDVTSGAFDLYLEVTVSLAVILLVSTAMQDIVNDLMESILLKRGSHDEKEIIGLNRKLKELTRVLKNSPFLEFARFLKMFPEDHFDRLTEGTEITTEALDAYLA